MRKLIFSLLLLPCLAFSQVDERGHTVQISADSTVKLIGSLTVDSNDANTVAILTIENTDGDIQIFRTDAIPEAAITGSIGDLAIDGTGGAIYIKQSGSASNTGWQIIAGIPTFKSYTFVARDANSGENFQAGFYDYNVADANLTIGGAVTQTHGEANVPYAAHAFCVASGAGGTDLVLTVSGTSITDAGARGNRDFTITDIECVGLANANDGGFEIELLHHKTIGWTYHASAFVAGTAALLSMNTIHSTEQDLDNGEFFAFKRSGLTTAIDGNGNEGIIVRITTGANNSVSYMDTHLGVLMH
jgi:hypothetical protein